MKLFRLPIVVAASAALIAAPALAAPANPAASLSVAKSVRATTTAKGDKLAGGPGIIIAAVAAIGLVIGIVVVSNDDKFNEGNSDSN